MAGKAIIPFNEASSTFTLEGEPSSANLALAVMEDDQEAEHIAKTPLAVLPASAPKGEMGGTDKGAGRTPGFAEPCRRPLGLLFYATHHQEDLRQEGQVPGLRRFCTTDDGDARAKGRLQVPLRRPTSTDAVRGGARACLLAVH